MSTFRTMTAESSMLTGFTFAGMRAAQGGEYPVLNMFYLAVTACSMGFGLLCISTATFVSSQFASYFLCLISDHFLTSNVLLSL
jgi:hypothetical protein